MTATAIEVVPGKVTGKSTVQKAISDLDGLISIAKREQLTQGVYVSHNINQELKDEGAICGGRQACLVGSLYLAHGIKPEPTGEVTSWYDYLKRDYVRDDNGRIVQIDEWELPGVDPSDRTDFMKGKASLRLAYQYLNQAALKYIEKNHPDAVGQYLDNRWSTDDPTSPPEGWGEHLFETVLDTDNFWDDYRDPTQAEIAEHKSMVQDVIIKVARNAKSQIKRDYAELLS